MSTQYLEDIPFTEKGSIFLYHMYLQIIKIDIVNKIILGKASPVVAFEFLDGLVQPDRLAQIKCVADFIQCAKYLVCSGIVGSILHHHIAKQLIVFPFFSP